MNRLCEAQKTTGAKADFTMEYIITIEIFAKCDKHRFSNCRNT